jgi:hypothetical protein
MGASCNGTNAQWQCNLGGDRGGTLGLPPGHHHRGGLGGREPEKSRVSPGTAKG